MSSSTKHVNQLAAALLLAFSFSAGASAQTEPQQAVHPNATLEADRITAEFQDSKRRSALLKAQIEELESELAKVSLISQIKMIEHGSASGSLEPDNGMNAKIIHQPQVLAIFGANNTLFASLLMGNGIRVDVKQGDALPDGFSVQRIQPDKVVLMREGKRYTLTVFSGTTETKAVAPTAASAR